MKTQTLWILLFISVFTYSQNTLPELLKKYNTESIPYISVEKLAHTKDSFIILDARELKEFKVSHLEGAVHVGYDAFNLKSTQKHLPHKNSKILIYCSLGVRSEAIGEKLKAAGYLNIFNLYGGIFEWKNNGFNIVDSTNKKTENVHVFSEKWGKWLNKGTKIYD
ncbi:rhodanese-like domain-containing protein [Mariniflexile sp.]|uniref:rhodanese-like domain-containing protein n=1 Tax=Mariniflexile sp. TaxID=1979402 RepID=UPI003566F671